MCSRLQPYVQEAAAILCSLFAGAMHTPRLTVTLTVTLKCSQPNLHSNLHPTLICLHSNLHPNLHLC